MKLHRRELLLVGAGAVAVKATAATLACAKDTTVDDDPKPTKAGKPADSKAEPVDTKTKAGPGHEDHKGHGGDAGGAAHASLAAASADCVEKAEACLQHCIALLSKGETSMAECAAAVHSMLAICRGLGTLALASSKHLPAAAQLCHDLCSDCAAACKPHAAHHATCKACQDACEAMMREAKAVLG